MGLFLAFGAGYALGAHTGSRDLDAVRSSLRAVRESEEFRDLLDALRSHAGATLRALAEMVETGATMDTSTQDLVERVRLLIGREAAGD